MVDDQASGVPASFTTGDRVRHLRERRGLSRPVLAGLAGYSSDWLKKIESGQRGISIPALLRLARLLDVQDLADLIDGDVPIPVAAWHGPDHPAASAVRKIVTVTSFTAATREEPPDVAALSARVARAWRDWHTLPDNHSTVAAVLPGIVAELEQAAIVAEGVERRAANAQLASAYGLAQHLAVDMVEPETCRVIADRAARAAQAADDPVSLAFGAWTYGHVLRSVDAEAALQIVSEAAAGLERHADEDNDAAGLLGSLQLHMAISAAYQGHAGAAWRFWDQAEDLAGWLPGSYYHPLTIFGSENLAIHGVSLESELRHPGAAASRAERIVPDAVPSRERRGRLYGEMAAAHMQRGELPEAYHFLGRSFETSPEEAPFSPLTRGVAVELVRAAIGPLKASAVGLAERMGVLPT